MNQLATDTTTCRTCGASLAPDQRYCLSCGTRVSSPRLDFLAETEHAAGQSPLPAAPGAVRAGGGGPPTAVQPPAAGSVGGDGGAPAPAGPSRLDKVGGPMGAAAVVLVALGVGFLIGQSGNEPPTVTQPAPVVNVQGGGTGGAAPATDDASGGSGTEDAGSGAGSARGAANRRAAADDARRVLDSTRGIPQSDGSENTGGDLNRLRALPDETVTPGAPPPRDDKEAGGGSEATEIG